MTDPSIDGLFQALDADEARHDRSSSTAPAGFEAADVQAGKADKPTNIRAVSTLFVRRIPRDTTNDMLEEFFSEIGPIRSCFVVADKSADDGEDEPETDKDPAFRNRGFGFVQYALPEDAKRAMEELERVNFRGEKPLLLEYAIKKRVKLEDDAKKEAKIPSEAEKPVVDTTDPKHAAKSSKKPFKKDPGTKPIPSRTIIVEGIPSRATKKHIYKKARKFGEVVRIAYPVGGSEDGEESSASPDSSTKNQVPDGKGTAQITFNKHEEAKVALKRLNNHVFMGAKITASLKPAFENKNYRLIVRNLPFKYREHDVEKLFSQHGLVLSVNLPRKYTGGPLRGFAFVQMGSLKDAERCLNEINGKNILGRIIAVDWALSQDKFKELVASHSTKSGADGSDDDDDDDKSEQGNDSDDADEASVKADESSEGEENIEAKDDYNSKENIESDNDTYSSDDDSGNGSSSSSSSSSIKDDDDNDGGGPNEDDDALKKGATLFIRNLSFNTEEETLYEKFREFGKLRYCRIVVDNQTGQSRGTAFVSFWDPTDAKACLEAAETAKKVADIVDVTTASTKPVNVAGSRSVLLPEAPASLDATTRFTLDGRLLVVSRAVDRNKAAELAKENIKKRQKDKRNLYLLREGVVFPNTPAAKLMTPAEVNRHLTEYNSQKALLTKNPNLFISKTRLSIHNLPLSVDAKALREAGKTALAAFKREVNNKSRQPLSVEELAQGWNLKPRIVQSKIVHSKDRIDTKTNKPRSKGFGFIEFSTHVHALACLRYMNLKSPKEIFGKYAVTGRSNEGENDSDKDDDKGKQKAVARRHLRVAFSVENMLIVKKREQAIQVARKRRLSQQQQQDEEVEVEQQRKKAKPKQKVAAKPVEKHRKRSRTGAK